MINLNVKVAIIISVLFLVSATPSVAVRGADFCRLDMARLQEVPDYLSGDDEGSSDGEEYCKADPPIGSKRGRPNEQNLPESKRSKVGFFDNEVAEILRFYSINPDFLWYANRYFSHAQERSEILRKIRSLGGSYFKTFSLIKETINFVFNEQKIGDNIIYAQVLDAIFANYGVGSKSRLIAQLERSNISVLTIDRSFLLKEEKIETEEERAQRKLAYKNSLDEFIKSNFNAKEIANARSNEEEAWEQYISYFDKRKIAIGASRQAKITRSEIEEIFENTVGKHYQRVELDDNQGTLFFNPKTIKLDLVKDEASNEDRLNCELAPIGIDGLPMNVHHVTHHQPGFYVLISQSFHQSRSKQIHFKSNKEYTCQKNIDRAKFELIKQNGFRKLLEALTSPPAMSVD